MESGEYDLMFRIEQTYWWYTGRRFLVVNLLQKWLRPAAPLAILDVGCGTGANLLALRALGDTAGCDVAPAAVAYCHSRGLTGVVPQVPDRIPFPDGQFDLVTCLDVIEHIEEDTAFMREIGRVLKPGGSVLFTTPAHKVLWSVHDESVHHKRRYARREFTDKLRAAGLLPARLTYLNCWLLPAIVPVRWLRDKIVRPQGVTSDFNLNLPGWLNRVFDLVFKSEWLWLRLAPLPFGLSLCALGRRPPA